MYTSLAPTLGRTLTDDELSTFAGGSECVITVGKNYNNRHPQITMSDGCRGMNITIHVYTK